MQLQTVEYSGHLNRNIQFIFITLTYVVYSKLYIAQIINETIIYKTILFLNENIDKYFLRITLNNFFFI